MIFLVILLKKIIFQELIILKLLMLQFKNLNWWKLPYMIRELGLVTGDLGLDQGHLNKMSLYRLIQIKEFKEWELLFTQSIISRLKQQELFRFQILSLIKIKKEDNHQLLWINKLVGLNQLLEGLDLVSMNTKNSFQLVLNLSCLRKQNLTVWFRQKSLKI